MGSSRGCGSGERSHRKRCGRAGRQGTGTTVTGQRPLKAPTEGRTTGLRDAAEGAQGTLCLLGCDREGGHQSHVFPVCFNQAEE